MLPRPIQQPLHMRAKTPGVFYRADYQFTAARRKTISPLGDAVISNLCPIILCLQGQSVCACVCVYMQDMQVDWADSSGGHRVLGI